MSTCAHILFGGSQQCTDKPIKSIYSFTLSTWLFLLSQEQITEIRLIARRVKTQVRHIGQKYMARILLSWVLMEHLILYL